MRISWRNIIIIALDVILAGYIFMAITSWSTPQETHSKCTRVVINIADENENGFLNTNEVKTLLQKHKLYPLGDALQNINPRKIETELTHMPFVRTAQCYVTKDAHVVITVTQRTPIIRIKSSSGEDYYLDDNGGVMPNSQYTSDMMIVSGSVTKSYATSYIFLLARYLMQNELWERQIEQINILPDNSVELIPRVGDHVVNIGRLPTADKPSERKEKVEEFLNNQLKRLELFYKYGLAKSGWDKYDYITLEYGNQIVCTKKQTAMAVDVKSESEATPAPEQTPSQDASTPAPAATDANSKKNN